MEVGACARNLEDGAGGCRVAKSKDEVGATKVKVGSGGGMVSRAKEALIPMEE